MKIVMFHSFLYVYQRVSHQVPSTILDSMNLKSWDPRKTSHGTRAQNGVPRDGRVPVTIVSIGEFSYDETIVIITIS